MLGFEPINVHGFLLMTFSTPKAAFLKLLDQSLQSITVSFGNVEGFQSWIDVVDLQTLRTATIAAYAAQMLNHPLPATVVLIKLMRHS
jgi:hypothetical protein